MSFRDMDPQEHKKLSSKGGLETHRKGMANKFTPEQAKTAGTKGGKILAQKRGRDYFVELGRKGGTVISANQEHMKKIGRIGGLAVSQNKKYMSEIGKKGGSAPREIA